jgi:hypothetical protein
MGKKRSDIHTIEAITTDQKNRTDDEQIHEEDKQALHHPRGKLAIPKRGENPALRSLRARRRGPAPEE